MDNINYDWLLNIRNDYLTVFFKLFPYLASDYFYILMLAIGYWLNPRKRLFIDSGFLVPFTTLINIILKNLFSLPRPPQIIHLVPYHIDYGFPSGDVQVAIVFWGMIYLNTNLILLRICSVIFVIGISISRIYLGVHSVADVLGGLIFGLTILLIYNTEYVQQITKSWLAHSLKTFWYILIILILIYLSLFPFSEFPTLALASIGVLIGLGIALKYKNDDKLEKGANIIQIFLNLILLLGFYKIFPVSIKDFEIPKPVFITIKYVVLALTIYLILPKFSYKTYVLNKVNF
jgi:membrane-associated phospholipid phosphatase